MICDECGLVPTEDFCTDCGAYLCDECMHEHKETFSYALPVGEATREDVRRTAERRRQRQPQPPRLSCHTCGNLSGGTAWWWDTRLWADSANGPICPVCVRAEEAEEATPRREPLTAPNALYEPGEEPWEE